MVWYLTVTLGRGRTTGGIIPEEKVAEVRGWIENYHKLKDHLEKIFEIRNQGRTILCVSHALSTLQNLCTRALWLDHGQLMMDGPVREVLQAYEGRILHAPNS